MTSRMKVSPPANAESSAGRRDELRQLLQGRRQELVATLHDGMKDVRSEHSAHSAQGGLDDEEAADVSVQEEVELALLQMKSETLTQIDQALARLEAGRYGQCRSCGHDIAKARLRVLPFAVRCRECEQKLEADRERVRADRGRRNAFGGSSDPLAHMSGW